MSNQVPLYKLERAKKIHKVIGVVGKIVTGIFCAIGVATLLFLVGWGVHTAWVSGLGGAVIAVGLFILVMLIYGVYDTYVLSVIRDAEENGVIDE